MRPGKDGERIAADRMSKGMSKSMNVSPGQASVPILDDSVGRTRTVEQRSAKRGGVRSLRSVLGNGFWWFGHKCRLLQTSVPVGLRTERPPSNNSLSSPIPPSSTTPRGLLHT
jgi:hypothetical protein